MKTGTENQEQNPINHEGLKTLYVELENFKNIDKKVVDIGGRSLIILGKNKSGKSTIIQAMTGCMDSKLLPSEPVKKGEEHARILHRIGGNVGGEYVEYTTEWRWSAKSSKGKVTVTDKDGAVMKSPATLIKGLIGNVSFDVTKWLSDPKEVKLKTIKELTGCGKEIDVINISIKALKESFKTKNDRAEELYNAVQNHGMLPADIEKYQNPVPIEGIQSELALVAGSQAKWDGVNNQINGFIRDVETSSQRITSAGIEINRLHELINQQKLVIEEHTKLADVARGNVIKGNAWKEATPRPTIDEVNARLTLAIEHNGHSSRIAVIAGQFKESNALRAEAEIIKVNIDKELKKRTDLIENSQLPIEGLTFSDEEIFIDGLPLEHEQINTATLFDIGVEVAIALNPKLKVIYLHDSSLYDREHLKATIKRIEERGYMAICEIVAENDEVECLFTEQYF